MNRVAGLLLLSIASAAHAQQAGQVQQGSQLAPVVVSAPKLTVEKRIDRTLYDVTGDVQSSFGTAADLLGTIPSIDVDGDGVVSLRGDSHVLILIDGKPSALFSGAAAGDNLQSLPAKDILRIEVLTNPPPQYKADGAAGVINIVTRKHHAEGIAGTLQASVGSQGRYQLGTNLGYETGPLSASLSATYRQDLKHRLQRSDLVAPAADGTTAASTSAINETIHRTIPPIALSLGYALDEGQSMSLELSRSGRGGLRTYEELNDTATAGGPVAQSTQRLSYGHDQETDYDEKVGFSRALNGTGDSLNATLHHSSSQELEHYDYANTQTLPPPTATFHNNLTFRESSDSTQADLDYERKLRNGGDLKAGYSFEQDRYGYSAAGANIDPVSGAQVPEPLLTDDFQYRQSISALYVTWEGHAGSVDWLGGARGEATLTDGQQISQRTSTAYRYLRLYPSLHINDHLSDQSTFSFAASRRVTRPDASNLNPYIDYEYTPNLRSGNANLRPQYTQSVEAGYDYQGRKSNYSVIAYYRRNSDSVTDVLENLGNGLSLSTKANLPRNDSSGLEFTAGGHLTPSLGYGVSGNLFYSQIDASALGTPGLRSTTGLNGKVKLDYRPVETISAQVVLSRTDKVLTPQGYVSAIDIVNIGYRQHLQHSWTALLTVSDLLDGQRYRRFAATPTFTESYQRIVAGRVVWIGVEYAFGSRGKDDAPKFEYDQ